MNFKKMFFIIIIICILFSLSSVYASEKNNNLTTNEFDDIMLPKESNNELCINEDTNELLGNTQSFSKNENFNDFKEIDTNHNDILLQYNDDDELGGNLIKTQISVSNYTVTLKTTSKSFSISELSANVQTTTGKSINKGSVYFEIYKTSYDKIKTYGVGVEKGVAKYTHNMELKLTPNKYTCKAYYSDYSKTYDSSSCTFYIIVKTKTEITVDDVRCNIGNSVTINPSLKYGIGGSATKYGSIIYTINSKRYTTTGSLTLTMDTAGKIKCTAQYIGTSYYLNSPETTFYITVADEPNIVYSLESTKILAGDKINLDYQVVDSTGNTVSKGIVKITQSTPMLMSAAYYNSLQSYSTNGHASITAPNIPGKYTYGIYYSGKNTDFQNSAKGFTIHIYAISKISSDLIKGCVGKTKNIKITVKDHLGRNINEGIVKSTINGRTYKANVKNGKAVFNNVKMPLKPNTYQYKVTYSTNTELYKNSNSIIKIICLHESKIKVKSKTGYPGEKVKLTATVKDGLGNNIKKGSVIFKINGKTYKATVKNGKAKVTIRYPKAIWYKDITRFKGNYRYEISYYKSIYTSSVTFKGDKNHISSSTKFKIISKATETIHKYRLYEYRTFTLPVKKGLKFYTIGPILAGLGMKSLTKTNKLFLGVGKKEDDSPISFKVKIHYKKHGKWRWDKWKHFKLLECTYGKAIKIDKVKIKCYSPHYVRIY